jgi:uncharacterized protein (DUF2252 family)
MRVRRSPDSLFIVAPTDSAADAAPSVEEASSHGDRAAVGKAARRRAPRSSHGQWTPAAGRPDPIEVLERQASTRDPTLVPIRYGRMLVSPFAFYRGAAAIMAADLTETPRSGIAVQLCGDAHLENFGVFAAPNRDLVFDINDFDETLPGPWEWDVKRLAASFAVAGRERGFHRRQRHSVLLTVAGEYRAAMRRLAEARNLDVWYERLDITSLAERWQQEAKRKELASFERNVAKARTKDSLRAFSKLTRELDGEPRIVSDPPLIVPLEELFADEGEDAEGRVREVLAGYRLTLADDRRHLFDQYRHLHTARKVVGVGSVGTRAYVALFVGRDDGDPLFLQAKEAEASVLEPYAGASDYDHHGQRVVEGQRLMQAASDIFLGWLTATGPDGERRNFYLRQLWDEKGSARVDVMDPREMTAYARVCGSTLARAHARSGDRIAIAGYLGRGDVFDRAIADFGETYADQNERDYAALRDAVASGRVTAREGV